MSDYALTAGQQQQIIDFLNAGKAVYVGGSDFGYYHKDHAVYGMFGCSYLGDSDNISSLNGKRLTMCDSVSTTFVNHTYTNAYVDWIGPNGGDILFTSEEGYNRVIAYSGPNGTYRAIHATYIFGAMKDAGATYTKAQIMGAYMRYLKGDDFVLPVACDLTGTDGGTICLGLEATPSEAGRTYGVLGTTSGTSPGFGLGFVNVPLNPDPFMDVVILLWNSPFFKNFMGTLDTDGRGLATIDIPGPLDPSWVGIQMHFAYVLNNFIDYASVPVEVNILP